MKKFEEIITYIKKNRISTTEVADALKKKGSLENLNLINDYNNIHIVGKTKCIFASNESNYLVHKDIVNVKKGDVVIIFTHNCNSKSIIGDLISKYILLYREASAIVVQGNIRDVAKLKKENYPIWCYGYNPVGCLNNNTGNFPTDLKKRIIEEFENSITVCDAGGVVVIKQNNINNKFLNELKLIEAQEDLWYYCLDTLKWNTLDIVTNKKYLKNKKIFSIHQLKQIKKLLKK